MTSQERFRLGVCLGNPVVGYQLSGPNRPVDDCSRQAPLRMFRALEIAEREFQSSEFGVIVVIEGEGDIQSVTGEEVGLLNALGHAPAEGIVGDRHSRASI